MDGSFGSALTYGSDHPSMVNTYPNKSKNVSALLTIFLILARRPDQHKNFEHFSSRLVVWHQDYGFLKNVVTFLLWAHFFIFIL